MANKWPEEISKFIQNPTYPGQFEICTKVELSHSLALPIGLKSFYVYGDPVLCTLECDHAIINVSGYFHRLYIIGIRNQINFTGTRHSVYLEGFHNQVNFCTEAPGGEISVQGDNPLSFQIGVSNGKITSENATTPVKLEFPDSLKDKRRRRLIWQPAPKVNEWGSNKRKESEME